MTSVPPTADRRDHQVVSPHGTRSDPYYWLRDDKRENTDVLAYVNAENTYTNEVLAPVKALEEQLFTEMRARIKEDDETVPVFERGYWYYARFETGKQYPIYARRAGTMQAPEEVLLDGNLLAQGHAFYKIGTYDVSPNGRMLAWAEDTVGRSQFTLKVKDLVAGVERPDTAVNMASSIEWANDNETLFFVGKDEVTLRTDRVFRKRLGEPQELVHLEKDEQFYTSLSKTKSHTFIAIVEFSTESSEVMLIDANNPTSAPSVYIPRMPNHLYSVEHLNGRFFALTNAAAKNFRIVEIADGAQNDRSAWRDVIAHDPAVLLEDLAAFDTFLAATVREGGLRKVLVAPWEGERFFIDAQDPAYVMTMRDTPESSSTKLRYGYESPTQPSTTFEIDVVTKERALLMQQPVPTYDPSKYASEYVHATAKDGTRIPISLVYHRDTKRDGTAPVLVYGYGSYGISMEPSFSASRASLMDRGWVYAIAHIRGGQEMGRAWYDAGKLQNKMSTFTDFIAATEYVVSQKYAASDKVFAMGGSAGGLLMGAIANMRPDLYRGIVSFVPFVDVVTTMLDESIPLTTNEYEEWGNPTADKAAYDLMLSYSPYDNIKPMAYPAIYIHTGLWDSQVQYWEPAKYVARLRATKTDSNALLLDTNMTAGHGGASGRFDALKELARAYAFMLLTCGRA